MSGGSVAGCDASSLAPIVRHREICRAEWRGRIDDAIGIGCIESEIPELFRIASPTMPIERAMQRSASRPFRIGWRKRREIVRISSLRRRDGLLRTPPRSML